MTWWDGVFPRIFIDESDGKNVRIAESVIYCLNLNLLEIKRQATDLLQQLNGLKFKG